MWLSAVAAKQASATQEVARMSADIVEKLQEKATVLTHESPGRFRSDEIYLSQLNCLDNIAFFRTASVRRQIKDTRYKDLFIDIGNQ